MKICLPVKYENDERSHSNTRGTQEHLNDDVETKHANLVRIFGQTFVDG